jgi:hypothetical protein
VAPALAVPNFLSAAKSVYETFPPVPPDRSLQVPSPVTQMGASPSTDGSCVWYDGSMQPSRRQYLSLRIFENV